MDQAVHIIALIMLTVALVYATAVMWMSVVLSPHERFRFILIWIAVLCAFLFVLYNPTALPGLLRDFPMPPNPLAISS